MYFQFYFILFSNFYITHFAKQLILIKIQIQIHSSKKN